MWKMDNGVDVWWQWEPDMDSNFGGRTANWNIKKSEIKIKGGWKFEIIMGTNWELLITSKSIASEDGNNN